MIPLTAMMARTMRVMLSVCVVRSLTGTMRIVPFMFGFYGFFAVASPFACQYLMRGGSPYARALSCARRRSRLTLAALIAKDLPKGGPGGVHRQTRLTVIDNSGAKKLKVIDYFGRRPATLGSAVRASVKEAKPDGRVSRKEIVAAVVVRQKAVHTRRDGTTVRFHENAAVLMKRDLSGPVGTRVTGPVARELRQGKFMKVALMAPRVI